ncbi:MAG: hypothetical protein SWK76_02015 [Actinomycetota bacterium]|nr:hypothetical protein [Actinomycetota bacterium]
MEDGKKVNFPPHCSLAVRREDIGGGGWREAVVSGGQHLKKVLDEYGELGFECLLEEIDPEEYEGCAECFLLAGERMYKVYVRPGRPAER